MAQTCLQLIQSALYRSNSQDVPSALVGATAASTLQILHLFYLVGEELATMKCWPQLKRIFKLRLVAGQERYDLPQDFYSELPLTAYDRTNSWVAAGPITDSVYNLRAFGTAYTGVTKAFRFYGFGGGQVSVNPTPSASDAISYLSWDYFSRSWIQPPLWTASEAGIAQNSYRSANGLIYKKTNSGSGTTSTVRPTMELGEGQDGGVRWLAITTSAYATTTLYAPGEYFTSGGNLYRVTVGGTSGSSAPTSTTESTDITNGSITCRYHSASSWAGETTYTAGSYMKVGSQYYRCIVGGVSYKNQPAWTTTTVTDNDITWTYQDTAYTRLLSDSDICVFDDELMIAGIRAKLFLARGLGAQDLVDQYERLKSSAAARFNIGKVLDLGAGGYSPKPFANLPEGNWPTW